MSSGMKIDNREYNKSITDLERIKDTFDLTNRNSPLKTFCEILAQVGEITAEKYYHSAVMLTGDKAPTVNSARWIDDTTMVLTASGEDILFIEFGTGILNFSNTYPVDTPDAARNAGNFYGSSYSVAHSGWLVPPKVQSFNGWWPIPGTHPKEWTSGNPPAKAMYEAGKEMRRWIANAADAAFGR